MELSKHLSLADAVRSTLATKNGVKNIPNPVQTANLKLWASTIYEPLYEKFGNVFCSSIFRSEKVNSLAGGSSTSAHVKGLAGDIDGNGSRNHVQVSNNDIFHFAIDNLDFDQVIAEFEDGGQPRWVHIGIRKSGNRKQVLIAVKRGGATVFLPYSPKVYAAVYFKGSRSAVGTISARRDIPKPDWETYDAEAVDPDLI